MCVWVGVGVGVCMCVCECVHVHVCTCMWGCACTCVSVCTYMCVCVYILYPLTVSVLLTARVSDNKGTVMMLFSVSVCKEMTYSVSSGGPFSSLILGVVQVRMRSAGQEGDREGRERTDVGTRGKR